MIGLANKIKTEGAFVFGNRVHYNEKIATKLVIPIYDRDEFKLLLDDHKERTMERIKVLLCPNPTGTPQLRLDEEAREIETKIDQAEHRDFMKLITKFAARPDDLLLSLNQHKPHVVQFSGHGSSAEEIILIDKKTGRAKPVSKQGLVSLLKTLKDNIRVVVLNACYSRPQAEAIAEEIECVVGMKRAIGDEAAITFAATFYRAIGFGRSIREAFDQGRTALIMEGIPEEDTPVLICRKNVDAKAIVLVTPE